MTYENVQMGDLITAWAKGSIDLGNNASFNPFMIETQEHGLMLHNESIDDELNKNLLDRHRSTIHETTTFALGPAVCCLKLVNLLAGSLLEALKTDERAFNSLNEYNFWVSLETQING